MACGGVGLAFVMMVLAVAPWSLTSGLFLRGNNETTTSSSTVAEDGRHRDLNEASCLTQTGKGGCPKLPFRGSKELGKIEEWDVEPDEDISVSKRRASASPSPVPEKLLVPTSMKDVQLGHPNKKEQDVLTAMYSFAYREGVREGWERGELERERKLEKKEEVDVDGMEGLELPGIEDAEAITELADPPSVEDGGPMSAAEGAETAMAQLATAMDGSAPTNKRLPEPPEPPGAKEDPNDVNDEDLEEGNFDNEEGGGGDGHGPTRTIYLETKS